MLLFDLKLQTKITLLVIIIVFASVLTIASLTTQWAIGNIQHQVEVNIMNVAEIIANTPCVIEGLSKSSDTNTIQPYVQKILGATNQVQIIVVADMEGIRYAHPNPERIGERFVGGDEKEVIEQGSRYISEATGTLGRALRAFVPVYSNNGQQVGFVMAGALTENIDMAKKQSIATVILASFIGMFLGVVGAILLADNIKNILLGLEPEEISRLYIVKKGILDAIHEGIIAIDHQLNITLVNDSAIKLLGIKDKNVIGRKIGDIFPTSRLPKVLETGVAEFDREQMMEETLVITNRVPIKDGDKVVGAIASFRDKTGVTKLAEELTGVRQIVSALRANTHEFMNKLHVILGLIQLGDVDEAKKYIMHERQRQQQIVSLVMNKIKDPTIAGLILGKFSRARELGIQLNMMPESCLERRTGKMNSHVMVTIIGNLIENAMEAVVASDKEVRAVDLIIKESSAEILIQVRDTGIGIKEELIPSIFQRGFTTKEGNQGIGLALLKEHVDNLKGEVEVLSQVGKGTEVVVKIPKEDKTID